MINPAWTNPSFIQNYYQNYSIDTTSYYKSISNYYAWNTDIKWKSLGDKVSNEQWSDEGYASYVNAFYAPQLNQVLAIKRRYDVFFRSNVDFSSLSFLKVYCKRSFMTQSFPST